MSSSPNASNTSELQAAIAINQLLSDNALAAEQAIEHLADITWQIQTAVAKLWEKVTPLPPQEALVLTEIENLVFWKLKGSQTALPMVQAIRLAKGLLQQGGFFNNMQGEGNWLFDEQRRPVNLGNEATRDLFQALRPILVLHPLDFGSAQIADFRCDDQSFPGHAFEAGELSVWGLKSPVPGFIEHARLAMMGADPYAADLPEDLPEN